LKVIPRNTHRGDAKDAEVFYIPSAPLMSAIQVTPKLSTPDGRIHDLGQVCFDVTGGDRMGSPGPLPHPVILSASEESKLAPVKLLRGQLGCAALDWRMLRSAKRQRGVE